jgi:hypothetical protein
VLTDWLEPTIEQTVEVDVTAFLTVNEPRTLVSPPHEQLKHKTARKHERLEGIGTVYVSKTRFQPFQTDRTGPIPLGILGGVPNRTMKGVRDPDGSMHTRLRSAIT